MSPAPRFGIGCTDVVYLIGDIKVLVKKLDLLSAEFFEGNTTTRNELVHVHNALLRLKESTRRKYPDITSPIVAAV